MPRSSQVPLRVAIAIATACALALLGCGSGDGTTSPSATAQRPGQEQAPERSAEQNDAKGPAQGQRTPSKEAEGDGASPPKAAAERAKQPQGHSDQHSPQAQGNPPPKRQIKHSEGGTTTVGCPPGLGGSDCKAAAEAVGQTPATPDSSSSGCPAGLSQAECEAAAKTVPGASSKGSADPNQCPPGVSATECREAAEALGH